MSETTTAPMRTVDDDERDRRKVWDALPTADGTGMRDHLAVCVPPHAIARAVGLPTHEVRVILHNLWHDGCMTRNGVRSRARYSRDVTDRYVAAGTVR